MKHEILRLERVNKSIFETNILNDFSFNIFKGEFLGFMCLNDAAKTTLLEYFKGKATIDSGFLYIDDKPIANSTKINPSDLGIYTITSTPNIIPSLPVANNVFLPVKKPFASQREIDAFAKNLLDALNIDIPIHTPAKMLSQPKQILLELAKAYISKARLIIIDVNFAEFSKRDYRELLICIKKLQKKGISFLLVFYDTTNLIYMMHRITIFRNGKNIKTLYGPDFNADYIKYLLLGTNISKDAYSHKPLCAEPVRLTYSLPGNNLEINTAKGEILGIVDSDYCFSQMLSESYLMDKYKLHVNVKMDQRSFSFKTLKQAYQNGVAFTFKHESYSELFDNISLSENIAMLSLERIYRFPINFSFQKHVQVLLHDHTIEASVDDKLPISHHINFTGYDLQKVLLNRLVVFSPKIIICTKPFTNLDPLSKKLTYSYFDQFASNGTTILIISNDLSAISPICDRIIILKKFEISAELQGEELYSLLSPAPTKKTPHTSHLEA